MQEISLNLQLFHGLDKFMKLWWLLMCIAST